MRTDLLIGSLNSLSSSSKQYEILCEQLDKTHKINTKLPALEKSVSRITVNANDKNTNFHTCTCCGTASRTETNTKINIDSQPSPACKTSNTSRIMTASSEAKQEMILSFIIKNVCNLKLAAFSAINTVFGSFTLADIIAYRPVIIKEQGSSVTTSKTRPAPSIACLRTNTIVTDKIGAKHKFNLMHTLDLQLLTRKFISMNF